MAVINSEEQTQILKKIADNLYDYQAMKLPVTELRVNNSGEYNSTIIQSNELLSDEYGKCVWSFNVHSPEVFLQIKEIETDNLVIAPYTVDTGLQNNVSYYTLNIFFNSESNIPANTYKAVVIG